MLRYCGKRRYLFSNKFIMLESYLSWKKFTVYTMECHVSKYTSPISHGRLKFDWFNDDLSTSPIFVMVTYCWFTRVSSTPVTPQSRLGTWWKIFLLFLLTRIMHRTHPSQNVREQRLLTWCTWSSAVQFRVVIQSSFRRVRILSQK